LLDRARRRAHDHQLAGPAEYPDPKTTKPEMWAWEFLRRKPNYRKDWERCAALPIERMLALTSPARILALKKYGLSDMMDPSCSAELCEPLWKTDMITTYGEFLTLACGQGNEMDIMRVPRNVITTEGRYHLPVSAEEVYVPFNLALPIETQLKRAKRILGELQGNFKREHPERSVSKRKGVDPPLRLESMG
jgi:transcriptional regulator